MRRRLQDQERSGLVELAQRTLWTNEGADVLAYLRDERGISDDEIRAMQFGYVPLRVNSDVRGRLIMPLFDPYERLVVITTRDIQPDEERPEWVKKHWHESFDKSQFVYGIHLAKQRMIATNKVIVVEGQFDVGYLRTIGFKNVVAVLGTAMTLTHAAVLARYCSEVYLLFDGDKGGREATNRSMEMYDKFGVQGYGVDFYPVKTPDGADPDDLSAAQVKSLCVAARKQVIDSRNNNGFYVHAA